MKQYVGTKVVEAGPATLYELKDGGHYLKKHREELDKQLCMCKIKDKVWELLGFLLQTGVQGV